MTSALFQQQQQQKQHTHMYIFAHAAQTQGKFSHKTQKLLPITIKDETLKQFFSNLIFASKICGY